jgi:aspartyl-tRNA(Asn)/glutamyl-tRNA(Gln) amidotransferase subunit A
VNIVPVDIAELDGALDCMLAIAMSEASTYRQASLRPSADLFGDETRLLLEAGEMMLATTYINAQRARYAIKAAFREALRGVDVILTPTQPTTVLKIGQSMSRIGSREETVFAVWPSRSLGALRLFPGQDADWSPDHRQAVRRSNCPEGCGCIRAEYRVAPQISADRRRCRRSRLNR